MIIDANVLFGFERESRFDLSVEKTLSLMEQKGIDKALITNTKCKFFDFVEGNNETRQVVEKNPDKFYALAGLNVAQFFDIRNEAKRCLKELGFAGLRLFNTDSSFISYWGGGLSSLSVRYLLDVVDGLHKLIFLEAGWAFLLCPAKRVEVPTFHHLLIPEF